MANDELKGILVIDFKPKEGMSLSGGGDSATKLLENFLCRDIEINTFLRNAGARVSMVPVGELTVIDLENGQEKITFVRQKPVESIKK